LTAVLNALAGPVSSSEEPFKRSFEMSRKISPQKLPENISIIFPLFQHPITKTGNLVLSFTPIGRMPAATSLANGPFHALTG
jgi:hypothetical protein